MAFNIVTFTTLKPKAMRSLFPIMSQWKNHSGALTRLENSFVRYGQLIIYLIAIGVIGFMYLAAQRAIANYLESLQSTAVPQL